MQYPRLDRLFLIMALGLPAASLGAAEKKPKADQRRTYGNKFFGEGGKAPVVSHPESGDFREEYSRQVGESQRPQSPAQAGRSPAVPALDGAIGDGGRGGVAPASPTGEAPARASAGGVAAPRAGRASGPRASGVASARSSGEADPEEDAASAAFGPGERPRDSVRSAPPMERLAARASPTVLRPLARPGARPLSSSRLGGMFDAAPARPRLEEPSRAGRRPSEPSASGAAAAQPQEPPAAPQAEGRPASLGALDLVGTQPDAAAKPGAVFVSLDLDLTRSPGDFRDAVAGLERSAGFSLDAKHAPIYKDSRRDRVSLWGWLPAGNVRQILAIPGVKRLEAAPQAPAAAAPAQWREPESEWRLVLRLAPESPGTPESAGFASALLRLSEAGFVWKRSEPREATGLIAVVGTMPARGLPRIMADPAVVRMTPHREDPRRADPSAPVQASAGPAALLGRYVQAHPLWLLFAALLPLVAKTLRQDGRAHNSKARVRCIPLPGGERGVPPLPQAGEGELPAIRGRTRQD